MDPYVRVCRGTFSTLFLGKDMKIKDLPEIDYVFASFPLNLKKQVRFSRAWALKFHAGAWHAKRPLPHAAGIAGAQYRMR